MASRLNSDIVICGVLEDDFRLPEEESSEKRVIAYLCLLEREYRSYRGGNFEKLLDLSTLVPMKEKLVQGVWKYTRSLCRR